jgi:hypothetical protein
MEAGGEAFKYSDGAAGSDPAWRVDITLGPSRQAGAWIAAVGLLGSASALASDAPLALRVGACVLLAGAAVHAARTHAWRRGRGAVRGFTVSLDGRIEASRADGRWIAGRIVPGSFVAPWLVVVRWVPDGAWLARTIPVFPDMAGGEERRRLRVLLRWGRG